MHRQVSLYMCSRVHIILLKILVQVSYLYVLWLHSRSTMYQRCPHVSFSMHMHLVNPPELSPRPPAIIDTFVVYNSSMYIEPNISESPQLASRRPQELGSASESSPGTHLGQLACHLWHLGLTWSSPYNTRLSISQCTAPMLSQSTCSETLIPSSTSSTPVPTYPSSYSSALPPAMSALRPDPP